MKKWALAALILLIGLAGLGIGFLVLHDPYPFPAEIRQRSGFELYYPAQLKDSMEGAKLTEQNKLLSFTVDYQGKRFFVTEQSVPKGFNFDTLTDQITESSQLLTAEGTATVGKLSQRRVASLIAGDTWIFITAGESASNSQIIHVVKQFKR